MSQWIFSSDSTEAWRASLEASLGKLLVRYTAETVHTEFDGDQTACSYRVIASNSDSVVIVCRTEDRDEERHLHFLDPETYWVSIGANKEYFRREVL
ncbi:hypothetical protein AAW51_4054 [Caldimonas brevitalea]|uniref:Uncharacterized protein n=1 Tax=Caldimonas brevitalea TaxID=413882 RepID=A0A0G3BW39_9BURK|nr:hypothetical protein AAW51_4054 [Caldimonas brevitalea]